MHIVVNYVNITCSARRLQVGPDDAVYTAFRPKNKVESEKERLNTCLQKNAERRNS